MKILTMPIYFFRELIFDSKEEYNIHSTSFNTRKVLTFLIVVISICLNIVMTMRIVIMALEIVENKATITRLQEYYDSLNPVDTRLENIKLSEKDKTPSTGSSK